MTGFIKRKIEALTFGEKLKNIRSQCGISLDEISRSTKIRKVYLQMLEDGNFDNLPSDVYVKGFLKNYTDYLGVDNKEITNLYEKEKAIFRNLKRSKKGESSLGRSFRFPVFTLTPKFVFVFLFLVGFFLISGYFYREIGVFSKDPYLVLLNPVADFSTKDDRLRIEGKTDKSGQIFVNEQAVAVGEDGNFLTEIGLRGGVNELEVRAINKFGNKISKKVSIVADLEEPKVAGEKSGENEEGAIFLETKSREGEIVNISWMVDGEEKKEQILLPGSMKKISAKDRIVLESNKPEETIVKRSDGEGEIVLAELLNDEGIFIFERALSDEEKNNLKKEISDNGEKDFREIRS